MGKVKCWKIKTVTCPESKRTITFKKPLQVIVEKIKRRWYLFRCVEHPVIWDYANFEKECLKYFTSLVFSFYDIYSGKEVDPELHIVPGQVFMSSIENIVSENAPE